MKQPNIIYIHTHDSGRYLQPYGHALPTPHLQRMAEQGVVFRQCFNAGPTCSPSRAALLTGQYPHQCGMLGLAHRGFGLNDYSRHLAAYLARNGYETALCGVQHETTHADRAKLGYTRLVEPVLVDQEATRARLAERGLKPHQIDGRMFIINDRAHAAAAVSYLHEKKDQPFFLAFGMISTHRPFADADEDLRAEYMRAPGPLNDNPRTRTDMAEYATMARCVDDCVGRIRQTLKETGLDRNTVVLFTTDHGIAFPKMKCHLYDDGIGVALLVDYPGNPRAGEVIDGLVSHVDIYPTLCELAGIEKPHWVEGKSLMPLLDKKVESVRDEIFSEVNYHAAYEPMRCVRSERYKFIRYFDDTMDKVVKPNIDDGYSKQFLMDNGLMEGKHDSRVMLFDLAHDPLERVNCADDAACAAVRADMERRLQRWMERTNDPLLRGPVPKPAGACVNNRWGVHPQDHDFE